MGLLYEPVSLTNFVGGRPPYSKDAIILDFLKGSYYWNGSTSLSTALIVQNGGGLVPNRDGTWSNVAANTLRVAADLGAFIESGSTNRLIWSRDPTNAAWTKSGVTLSDAGYSALVGTVPFTVIDVPVGQTFVAIPAGITTIDAYAIGPGGDGAAGVTNVKSGAGGGAGAYTHLTAIAVTPSTNIEVQVPAGGVQLPTYLKNNAGTIVVSADYGRDAVAEIAGVPGNLSNCVGGSVKLTGGAGGAGQAGTGNRCGGGGGGSPLPVVFSGLGSNYSGRNAGGGNALGGGGGGSNGAPGTTSAGGGTTNLGGAGSANHLGLGGGAGGTPTVAAGNGVNGGAGAGGSSGVGLKGGNGSNFTASLAGGLISRSVSVAGSGAGGGGIKGIGGIGGAGGGGGGGGSDGTGFAAGGAGGPGKLLVAYGGANSTRVTASAPGGYIEQTYTPVTPVAFTATIAGTVMNVTAVSSGSLVAQLVVLGAGVTPNTTIVAQPGGTFGGIGTYTISPSQTVVAPTSMNAVPTRTPSLVVKGATVTGPIYLSQDGGVTQTDIRGQLVANKWPQAFAPYDAVLIPKWRLTFANTADAVDIDYAQLEDRIAPSSPIATTTGQGTRLADEVKLNLAAFPAWVKSDKVTILQTAMPLSGNAGVVGPYTGYAWTWINIRGFGTTMGAITASQSSSVLTVTDAGSVALRTYEGLSGAGVSPDSTLFGQLSGTTGGAGTYSVLPVQSVPSETMQVLPQQGYACNATIKSNGDRQIGCTVVNSLFAMAYGFDPQTAEFDFRKWNRLGFSAWASEETGITALNGDCELSDPDDTGGHWADPSKFDTVMLGGQMPGAVNNLNGFIGQLIIIPGEFWDETQLAIWTKGGVVPPAVSSFDFTLTPGQLPAGASLSRPSVGWSHNSSGALTSYGIDIPRWAYNPSTLALRGLLVEPAATNTIRNNSMTGAIAGTPGTNPTNWTMTGTANNVTRTLALNTEDGFPCLDVRFAGTPSANGSVGIYAEATQAAVLTEVWSSSHFLRLVAGSLANITLLRCGLYEANAGGAGLQYTIPNVAPTGAALRTQRSNATDTMDQATVVTVRDYFTFTYTSGLAIDATFRMGGMQLVKTPAIGIGSPIMTTAGAITRAADVLSIAMPAGIYNVTIVRESGTTVVNGAIVGSSYIVPSDPSPLKQVSFAVP